MPKCNKEVGYNTYDEFKKSETIANELGFKFGRPSRSGYENDYLTLYPKDQDSVPIYDQNAELFTGTLGDVQSFIYGIKWARDYDRILKVSDSAKRERKEQDERNRQLVAALKQDEVKE